MKIVRWLFQLKDNSDTIPARDNCQYYRIACLTLKREAAPLRQPLINLNLIVDRPDGLIKEGKSLSSGSIG